MWRTIGSMVAGFFAWGLVVTLLNFGLRAAIPSYHAAEATLQFTMAMKAGRLIEAAIASLAAGALIGWLGPLAKWAPCVVGAVILAMFLPDHVQLWNAFPIWYHLAFLVPLVPLVVVGAALVRGRTEPVAATA